MMELLQYSTFSLIGLWVAISCLSGLIVFLLLKLFDFLYPNQSSSDRYHKNIAGLIFFFILNLVCTYYFNMETTQRVETSEYVQVENTIQIPKESITTADKNQFVRTSEPNISDYFTSNVIFKSLGIFWLIGALIFSMKMIGGYFYTRSLVLEKQKSIPKKWLEFIQSQLEELRIKREVKVFESFKINSAFTFGFIKPMIALPLGFFTTLPAEQIEAVLLHELYHIKHKDYLVNLMTMTFEVIFFYHPLMWWLAKNIRIERENRCDDQVTKITDKHVYAHALVNMEHYRQSLDYAIPFSTKQSNLKMRIMRIFEQKPERNIGLKPFLSLLLIVIFLMGFTFYKIEEPKKESKQEKTSAPEQQQIDKQNSEEPKDKVFFKSENTKLGLVIEMTRNTLIAKTENDKVKLYVDEKLYPLNEKIPFGEEDIATMYENDEGYSHHFFSRQYFESHDRDKWEKDNENRNTYVFDKITGFFTFRPAKDLASEPDNVSNEEMEEMISEAEEKTNSISKMESKPANLSEINIFGPIQFRFEDKNNYYGDTSNLEILEKLIKKFNSKDNSDVKVRIDGKLIKGNITVEDALDVREIKNIRILLPSKDAETGEVEIYTNGIVGKSKGDVLSISENIIVDVQYKTEEGYFRDEKKMNVKRDNVLDVLKINNDSILFVVAGEVKNLGYRPNNIDPNEIESITVLKDEKATDKYGDKAKNGVVEIYLKKE